MLDYLIPLFQKLSFLNADMATLAAIFTSLFALIGAAILVFFITRFLLVGTINRILKKTASKRDDILADQQVFGRLAHIAPALLIYLIAPRLYEAHPIFAKAIISLCMIYLIIVTILFIDGLMNAGLKIYRTYDISRTFPIKSFIQVAKLVMYFLGFITILSVIFGESPMSFLAGFGALTAVIMLIFKDPILGFVAGIQLSANKMLAVGDWIEMPKYGVDGDIIEIALTTVKIRNFDKTITTIPTQSLITDSFKNWRGMQESGGRRIKRAIHIDVSSIKFCDEEMLERFSKFQYISEYIAHKKIEIDQHNESYDLSSMVNGKRLTNIGTFRAYIQRYLKNHPQISEDFTLLVRQLKPDEHGLPIEIYTFTNTTNWLTYENIQADIFDHILAAVREFDLRIFQHPSGSDFQHLISGST